ncbi:DUF2461 domain-containing protein [Parabacteroides sp. OttesenSCG-928-N08]|nr:DUF2461 domain-containing protein [Parabacteroides sp. OttesenSCG-928-N08]
MQEDTFLFFRELKENNDRNWFKVNKARYDVVNKQFEAAVQQVITGISAFDPEVAGLNAKDCLFRIYRDVRFSPNKEPYKTHLGAYIAKGSGRKSPYSGYYIHLEPDNCLLSGGMYMPEPKLLKKLRQDIYDQIEEFTAIMEEPTFKALYPELDGEMLKRMPTGFPIDSPYGDILKHKNFCVFASKPDSFFLQEDWITQAVEAFRILYPFNQFLNYTVDDYLGLL